MDFEFCRHVKFAYELTAKLRIKYKATRATSQKRGRTVLYISIAQNTE